MDGQDQHMTRTLCVVFAVMLALVRGQDTAAPCSSLSDHGLYPLPRDCSKYIRCNEGKSIVENCPRGKSLNPSTSRCDFYSYLRCLHIINPSQQLSHDQNMLPPELLNQQKIWTKEALAVVEPHKRPLLLSLWSGSDEQRTDLAKENVISQNTFPVPLWDSLNKNEYKEVLPAQSGQVKQLSNRTPRFANKEARNILTSTDNHVISWKSLPEHKINSKITQKASLYFSSWAGFNQHSKSYVYLNTLSKSKRNQKLSSEVDSNNHKNQPLRRILISPWLKLKEQTPVSDNSLQQSSWYSLNNRRNEKLSQNKTLPASDVNKNETQKSNLSFFSSVRQTATKNEHLSTTSAQSPSNFNLIQRYKKLIQRPPHSENAEKKLVCYYTNWAQYRPGGGKFLPENINPYLCTHIHYAFAKFNSSNEMAPYEWNDESTPWSVGMYERVTDIRNYNPKLKVVLSLGGWNLASAPFTAMAATKESRGKFIQAAIVYLRQWKFDGIGIDWEYPGARGSPPEDKHRFTLLAQEMMAAFQDEAQRTRAQRLILSAAVGAGKDIIDNAYEIPQISQVFDYFNLMSFDFFGAWDNVTGHLSPLFPPRNAQGLDKIFNVQFAADYWVSQGCPKEKLNIGLVTYGRSFTLTNPQVSDLKAPDNGPGRAGTYTREAGFLSYYELCGMIQQGARVEWLDDQKVPYLVLNNQWVGYENEQSLQLKVQFIKDSGFSGAMVWNLDLDDFNNAFCGHGAYPLITTIRRYLSK